MNSELYNKKYYVPKSILNKISVELNNNSDSSGVKRAKFILNNKYLTYQAMKGILHDLQNCSDKTKYELMGGDSMFKFIDNSLNSDREHIKNRKDIMPTYKTNLSSGIINSNSLNEEINDKKFSSTCIIIKDYKFLLAKRSYESKWEGGKWALIGGSCDIGETPKECCIREVREECGIELNPEKVLELLKIQRKDSEMEYIFITNISNENITINSEHIKFDFFTINEIKQLNTVPELMEYLKLAIKKYK